MDREEILLKEYELCEQDSSSSASRYWAVVGTFVGFSTAVLAALNVSSNDAKWLTLGIGIAAIKILCVLRRWLGRINTTIFTNNFRMREIEQELHNIMLKNRTINWLDGNETVPREHEDRMNKLRAELNCEYQVPARKFVPKLFWVTILLWLFIILVAWWPSIKQLFFGN